MAGSDLTKSFMRSWSWVFCKPQYMTTGFATYTHTLKYLTERIKKHKSWRLRWIVFFPPISTTSHLWHGTRRWLRNNTSITVKILIFYLPYGKKVGDDIKKMSVLPILKSRSLSNYPLVMSISPKRTASKWVWGVSLQTHSSKRIISYLYRFYDDCCTDFNTIYDGWTSSNIHLG